VGSVYFDWFLDWFDVYLEVVSVQSKARDTITDPGERERNRDESCVCCLGRIRSTEIGEVLFDI